MSATDCHTTAVADPVPAPRAGNLHTPVVALVGPPNSGKTSLYNRLTGLRQKVANYPGVTVEKHLGRVRLANGLEALLVDLPGVNGFAARTPDERVTLDVLHGKMEGVPTPDAVILVVDSTRLEPHLMLAEHVGELGLPTLLVLNMADELEHRGGRVDDAALSAELGFEVLRTNARAGRGVEAVRNFIASISSRSEVSTRGGASPRSDTAASGEIQSPNGNGAGKGADVTPALIAEPGRRIVLPVLDEFTTRRARTRAIGERVAHIAPRPSRFTDSLDSVLLHKWLGPATFLVVVTLVFQAIFSWAVPLMDLVEAGAGVSGDWLAGVLGDTWYRSLLVDGMWQGVAGVVVFLPQILMLFLFIGFLEDSGYMARAAVIADRSMQRVGLQGRAFLPLLSAYACAVPAIMSARTIEDERDRFATIFVAPFMTCSARLPVYALLIAAFVPERRILGPFLGTRAASLLGLYLLGAFAAIGTAFLLKRTVLRGKSSTFVMDLPPYRWPTLRSLALRLVDRSKVFLWRVGRVILLVTVILWALTQVPRAGGEPPSVENSALGQIGHAIEPAIEPLGFDWRIGVGLVASLAAREVIVGTLGTIYGIENADDKSLELRDALLRDLSFGSAIALLVFFAFALQCTSTIAVVRRETGSWKWASAQFGYMLALAYVGALLAKMIFS